MDGTANQDDPITAVAGLLFAHGSAFCRSARRQPALACRQKEEKSKRVQKTSGEGRASTAAGRAGTGTAARRRAAAVTFDAAIAPEAPAGAAAGRSAADRIC